ncbi:MAG: acyl-CoA dehydrogenase domain protein [Nocardioides sp.]|nr:acyl-CoA dehydrogenase domain protein [Nocardioides sp.]
MRFVLDEDQRDFGSSLDRLLAAADTVAVARAWADDDTEPGLALWRRLAEQGVTTLATDATTVELCVAFEVLGRHAVPGPWVESAAYLPVLLGRELGKPATVAVSPHVPLALDADVATTVLVVDGADVREATPGERRTSVDPVRRLYTVTAGEPVGAPGSPAAAFDLAVLAASAQLLGLGEHLLGATVAYVKQRRQFGREIGSYQALKHRLADVRIALDFARPLVFGAALGEVPASASKVAAGDAAHLAARTALQLHGAVGYTRELDLSLWILKVRALQSTWGTAAHHRARILEAIC